MPQISLLLVPSSKSVTNDIMELDDNINPDGDLQVTHHDTSGGQERRENHIRDGVAAFLSAPALPPHHLQEHWVSFSFVFLVIF